MASSSITLSTPDANTQLGSCADERKGEQTEQREEEKEEKTHVCIAGTQRGQCGRPVAALATANELQLCVHHLADRRRGESASAAALRRRREEELAQARRDWIPPAGGWSWPLAVTRVVHASIERMEMAMQRAGAEVIYVTPSHAGRVSVMVTQTVPLEGVRRMPALCRQLQQNGGLLPVQGAADTLPEAISGLAALVREQLVAGRDGGSETATTSSTLPPLRLQCVPHKVLGQVLEACESVPEIDDRLDAAADGDSLNVVQMGESLWLYGYSSQSERLPALFFPDTRPDAKPAKQRDLAAPPISDQVCRAAMKLQELGEGDAPRLRLSEAWYALDIGAAPGGWTQYLAAQCRRVVAVDPAALDAGVLSLDNVVHIREKVQLADEALRQNADPESGLYDLIVCDMNMAPDDAARCVLAAAGYLKPGGKLVLTLKLVRKSKAYPAEAEAAVRCVLSPAFADFDVDWLFANTNHERTLLATRTSHPVEETARPPAL